MSQLKEKMIPEEKTSVISHVQNEEVYERCREYERCLFVPRFSVGNDGEIRYCIFPKDDDEVLRRCKRSPLRWIGVYRYHRPEIYLVKVKAGNCTVKECLELLKVIGRENRFIACSVESAGVFFAELNKEDADKLKGLAGICYVFRHVAQESQIVQH